MPLCVAAPVAEPDHSVRLHLQIGDDELTREEQLARMPFDLGDHPARPFLTPSLILKFLVELLNLGL